MAWLTVAQSNEELVNKLVSHNILSDEKLIQAFRLTDRGDFVHQDQRLAVSIFEVVLVCV